MKTTSLEVDYSKYIKTVTVTLFACILLVLPLIGMLVAFVFDTVVFEKPGLINISSVVLFLLLSFFALASERIYFLVLPFMLLAFPAAVNDFFPAIYLGTPSEFGASAFPFITHIDIFLLLGILPRLLNSKRVLIKTSFLSVAVISLFFLSSVINMITSKDAHTTGLIIQGLYPIRYFVFLVILLSYTDIEKHEKQIIYSLIFSVFFLLLESFLNTQLSDSSILVSGSLGANTFANIICGLLIFFIYLKRNKFPFPPFIFVSLCAACIFIILLTQTRIAIVAGVVSYLLIQVYHYKFFRSLIIVTITLLLTIVIYSSIEVPKRYSIENLSSKVRFNYFSWNPSEMITIERSAETSSFHSRLKLYSTTFRMIGENPFFGTGYGSFNYVKNDYGFDERILIDAHNGYLSSLSQLGMIGILFIYLIYFRPFFSFKKIRNSTFLKFLFVINITVAIADLTNAGIYKHSVFAILAFNAIIIAILEKQSKSQLSTY